MAKAVREMEKNLDLCDAVAFVLDARAPASTYNPRLEEIAGRKPVLFILNKSDLADGALSKKWKESGKYAVALSATSPSSARPLRAAMEKVASERIARLGEKGTKRAVRFLVSGIPNTGKSTVINLLAGQKKANVGDKAGVTRGQQWVKCGGFDLLDSPGVMPPSCENQVFARRLAYLGCLNDDILALDEIALCLLEELAAKYPAALAERYGIGGGEPAEMLGQVCKKRGFILRGGEYDYERGERALLDDLRKGKLGRVCLDGEEDLREAGLL